jgi:hypothetical protein
LKQHIRRTLGLVASAVGVAIAPAAAVPANATTTSHYIGTFTDSVIGLPATVHRGQTIYAHTWSILRTSYTHDLNRTNGSSVVLLSERGTPWQTHVDFLDPVTHTWKAGYMPDGKAAFFSTKWVTLPLNTWVRFDFRITISKTATLGKWEFEGGAWGGGLYLPDGSPDLRGQVNVGDDVRVVNVVA